MAEAKRPLKRSPPPLHPGELLRSEILPSLEREQDIRKYEFADRLDV